MIDVICSIWKLKECGYAGQSVIFLSNVMFRCLLLSFIETSKKLICSVCSSKLRLTGEEVLKMKFDMRFISMSPDN